jgi:hypothetical protein
MTLSIRTFSLIIYKMRQTLSIMANYCYAECHLCWVSLMLSVTYVECHLCCVSLKLSGTYAVCHLCCVSLKLSVTYAECHLCWVLHITPLRWVSLWWMMFWWVSLCWVSWRQILYLKDSLVFWKIGHNKWRLSLSPPPTPFCSYGQLTLRSAHIKLFLF